MIARIVLGMAEGELLNPCTPQLSKKQLRKIHDRVRTTTGQFPDASSCEEHILELRQKGYSLVEIYGLWQNSCIASATAHALMQGLSVRVPKGFTFIDQSSTYDHLLGRENPTLGEVVNVMCDSPPTYRENKRYHCFTP